MSKLIDKLIKNFINTHDKFWLSEIRRMLNIKCTTGNKKYYKINSQIRKLKRQNLIKPIPTSRPKDMLYVKINQTAEPDYKISKL